MAERHGSAEQKPPPPPAGDPVTDEQAVANLKEGGLVTDPVQPNN